MGCNCNKRKKARPTQPPAQPSGSTTPATSTTPAEPAAPSGSFELRTISGQTLTFGSRLEAEAAKARRGGAGKIRPV